MKSLFSWAKWVFVFFVVCLILLPVVQVMEINASAQKKASSPIPELISFFSRTASAFGQAIGWHALAIEYRAYYGPVFNNPKYHPAWDYWAGTVEGWFLIGGAILALCWLLSKMPVVGAGGGGGGGAGGGGPVQWGRLVATLLILIVAVPLLVLASTKYYNDQQISRHASQALKVCDGQGYIPDSTEHFYACLGGWEAARKFGQDDVAAKNAEINLGMTCVLWAVEGNAAQQKAAKLAVASDGIGGPSCAQAFTGKTGESVAVGKPPKAERPAWQMPLLLALIAGGCVAIFAWRKHWPMWHTGGVLAFALVFLLAYAR